MGKELPVIPSPQQSEAEEEKEELIYSRVFCTREDSPPLRLLLDFLKSKNQIPLIPKMEQEALEDWDWVHISLGYNRERQPANQLGSFAYEIEALTKMSLRPSKQVSPIDSRLLTMSKHKSHGNLSANPISSRPPKW
jgi:hypothetical protein